MPPRSPTPATPWPARPELPCAWGDAFDRLTILRLKAARIDDAGRNANVRRELAAVAAAIGPPGRFPEGLAGLVASLEAVNARLWDAENAVRDCERRGAFDAAFVTLARAIVRENAERARLKAAVSRLLGSALVEEKSYAPTA